MWTAREREKHLRFTMIPLFCTEIDMKSIKIYSWSHEKLCVLNSFSRFCSSISFHLSIHLAYCVRRVVAMVSFELISLLVFFSFAPMWNDEIRTYLQTVIHRHQRIHSCWCFDVAMFTCFDSLCVLLLLFFSLNLFSLVSFISAFGWILWPLL